MVQDFLSRLSHMPSHSGGVRSVQICAQILYTAYGVLEPLSLAVKGSFS